MNISLEREHRHQVWLYITPDLPLSPSDATSRVDEVQGKLEKMVLDIQQSPKVGKRSVLALFDQMEIALTLWRPAVVRRALLEELIRSCNEPKDERLKATLALALGAVYDSAWSRAMGELRSIAEREGRICRQADHTRLTNLAANIIIHLHNAQKESEQAWEQVMICQQLWGPAAIWLEYGLRYLLTPGLSDMMDKLETENL